MKVLYIFAGERDSKFKGTAGVDFSGTSFYGQNHLKNFGIKAIYKEWWNDPLMSFVGRLLGFNLRHAFMFFRTFGQDIVFGSSVLNMMIFRKFIPRQTKFVMLNISLTRLWQNNKNKKIKGPVIRWLLKSLDGVVCLSTKQKDFCVREFHFLKGKTFFVPFGVDVSFLKFIREGREDFILSAGRDNGRDYKTVLEVARLMPNENFEIVCSPRNLGGIVDIPKNVKVYFDITKKELEEKYKKAKILLLITHDDDYKHGADCSGQTVLLESFAMGLPVIATKRASLRDYVSDKNNIALVGIYDVSTIIEKVNLFGDESVRERLAKNAREMVEENFSTKIFASGVARVFKDINSKSNNG